MFKILSILLVFTFMILGQNSEARRKIALDSGSVQAIEGAIEASQMLHKALVSDGEPFISKNVTRLITAIGKAITELKKDKLYGNHISRMLQEAHRSLEDSQVLTGEDKKMQYKVAFKKIVELARSVKLSKKYPIYFCNSDRSEWVQMRDRKNPRKYPIRNPIDPSKKCGVSAG